MEDFRAALAHFKRVDPILYRAGVHVKASLLSTQKRRRVGNATLFAALASSVVSQQLATKAADSIWARVRIACGGRVTAETIRRVRTATLRKAGLSEAKANTLKALSKEVGKGLSLTSLSRVTKEEAEETLTKIWGIGPWTCEMFLMFALNHPDIFSTRDLGLVRSIENLYGVKNPSHRRLEKISKPWSPYRSYACRILWKHRDTK